MSLLLKSANYRLIFTVLYCLRCRETTKPRRSAFTRSAKVPEGSKFSPRPPEGVRKSQEKSTTSKELMMKTDSPAAVLRGSGNLVEKTSGRSSRNLPNNEKELSSSRRTSVRATVQEPSASLGISGVRKDEHSKDSDSMKVEQVNLSARTKPISTSRAPTVASSRAASAANEQRDVLFSSRKESENVPKLPEPTVIKNVENKSNTVTKKEHTPRRHSAAATPRHNKDGTKSAADGKLTSRASSRLSYYG